jgi:hypothetical protein
MSKDEVVVKRARTLPTAVLFLSELSFAFLLRERCRVLLTPFPRIAVEFTGSAEVERMA